MDPLKLWGKPVLHENKARKLMSLIIEAKEYAKRMLGYDDVVEGPSPEDLVRALVYGFKVEEGICGNVVVNFGNGEFTVMPPLRYEAFTIAYSYILSKLFNDS